MATNTEQIKSKAFEILKSEAGGVRYSDLVNRIKTAFPQMPINTIHGVVWQLHSTDPREVYKAARGLFKHIDYRDKPPVETTVPTTKGVREEDFYQPFAEYLKGELEDCDVAKPLGGNVFRNKWNTPDVFGFRKQKHTDIIKETVLTSAEIKTNPNDTIAAFGQACAYKLFSHLTYLVVPDSVPSEDKDRIESLCQLFGIGLILFNNKNPAEPNFQIRVRPIKHNPDTLYANQALNMLIEKGMLEL